MYDGWERPEMLTKIWLKSPKVDRGYILEDPRMDGKIM
jgi:hypothetical protein